MDWNEMGLDEMDWNVTKKNEIESESEKDWKT